MKIKWLITYVAAAIFCASASPECFAQEEEGLVYYEVSAVANTSSGTFAPYLMSALSHGKIRQKNAAFTDILVEKGMNYDSRFSWGFGAEMIAGWSNTTDYMKYDADNDGWLLNPQGQPPVWIQQLYAEIKYRSLFMSVGLKEHTPVLLNPELSSGDFVESGNARPIPEVRIGFHDFVDIPLTNGWMQIMCQAAYGIMPDDKYMRNHYNYYNYHLTENSLYNYKCVLFRTNPDKPLMLTFGMQAAGLFAGESSYYNKGKLINKNYYHCDFQSFLNILVPIFNSRETFAEGSSLGSWDFYSQYMLPGGSEICAYFQWPFEDGSGIARRNKMDGIWGLELQTHSQGLIDNIVVEYIDFRDQSGPIHYAPGDFNNSTITSQATGSDNYYNNGFYNAYANYGMSIGTPFLPAPYYNLDGYPAYTCNRANGVHIGIDGYITPSLKYKALFGYQRGLGTYYVPYPEPRTNTSALLEAIYTHGSCLAVKAQMAMDKGSLRGNSYGALLSVSYSGDLSNLFGK